MGNWFSSESDGDHQDDYHDTHLHQQHNQHHKHYSNGPSVYDHNQGSSSQATWTSTSRTYKFLNENYPLPVTQPTQPATKTWREPQREYRERKEKRKLELELERKKMMDEQYQQQHWPSLCWDEPSTSTLTPPPTTAAYKRSSPHQRQTYVDFWEDWEPDEHDDHDAHPFSEGGGSRSSAARVAYEEDVDLGEWRRQRVAKKGQVQGRRVRGRKARGDLFDHDYHAGHTKEEIMSMCRERQAEFEAQALRREA